jgi:AraC-like DNA-binding protein
LDEEVERRRRRDGVDRFECEMRREYLRAAEQGETKLVTIARSLGVSSRVLQRRLQEVGLSHRALRDAARADYAKSLLRYGDKTVVEVAQALRFSEPAAFVRTFRRWTGMTPGHYRRAKR